MIGVDQFASVFGGEPGHTAEHTAEHLRAVIRAGYSPVLCKPGGKETACILSAVAAKRADREAQARAVAANPRASTDRIRHSCGFKHVLDDPSRVGAIAKRFTELHRGVNVGLHLGRSRLIVVDVDTPAERQEFLNDFEFASQQQAPGITVESPGSYDYVTGTWKHWGGGHWWFTLPEEFEFPPGKVLKMPGGWAIMYGEAYALVPPSSRPEGTYRLVGGTTTAPAWMLEALTVAGEARKHTADQNYSHIAGGPIDQWSARTSWSSLLEPRGWIETSMVEGSCGCPVWTAPGEHSSPKSATAHDLSCARFDVSEGWGPLKIWTDHPPEGLPPAGAVTKVQFVAASDHAGDDGAAIKALGIERSPAPPAWAVPTEWTEPLQLTINGEPVRINGHDPFTTPGALPDPSQPQTGAASGSGELSEERPSWADVDLGPYLDGSYVPPVPTLMPRSDGMCLLYPGMTHSIHGESESGKSWVAQCESARLVKLGQHVKYVDFESDAGPVTGRMLALGCTPEEIKIYFHYSAPEVRPGADQLEYEQWSLMFTGRFALVVIDGVTDALGIWGLKTTDNDDWTAFNRNFPKRLAKETNAAVLMVDHVTKDKIDRGRFALGGQAKMNTLTGAAYVVDVVEPMGIGARGVLALGLAKDKGGWLRGRLGQMDRNRVQPVAQFILDGTSPRHGLLWAVLPPEVEDPTDVQEERRRKIIRYLRDYSQSGTNEIVTGVGGKRVDVISTLQQLVSEGHVVIERIGQKQAHTLITPITELLPVPGSQPVPGTGN